MTRKLLVTIALGAALAIIAAGTATSLTVGGAQVSTPTVGALPQCSNLSDDDGDGLVDLADPGCSGPLDTSEYNAPTSDGSSGSGGSGTTTSGGGSTTTTGDSGGSSGGGNNTTTTSGKVTKKTAATKSPGLFGKQAKKGQGAKQVATAEKQKIEQPTLRNPNGSPANTNPGLTVATFGPAPIGVPNFVIDSFEIPPFLLPIYQSCGTEYGIPWQVLAGINKIETAFGTNLNVSTAGAEGWMQFIPSTWAAYGVDANNDGRKDPYNPVDAICAAARYLRAAGGDKDIRQAIFSYNHADWYVDEVLLYANQYGKLPDALVGSLTGLTEGAHFPVAADARYADDINDAAALARSTTQRRASGNAADVISSDAARRSINIYSSLNAPVVAVNDGVIKKIGDNPKLGRYIVLQDAYGNTYTYSQLGSIEKTHPVPRSQNLSAKDFKLGDAQQGLGAEHAGDRGRQLREGRGEGQVRQRAEGDLQLRERPPAALRPASALRQRGQPGHRRPDRAAARPQRARLRDLQVGLLEQPAVRLQHDAAEAAQGRLQGNRRHRDRAHRQDRRSAAAPQLRNPAGRPRRSDDRPEADPRRLEAARDHRDLPRRRQESLHRQPHRRTGPADVEGSPRAAGAERPGAVHLRLRP